MPHPCVQPSTLIFECPVDNNITASEPLLVEGDVTINCQICDMAAFQYNDSDNRPGIFAVSLEFGPNVLDGMIDETIVTGYLVYLVDNCSRQLGDYVAVVEKQATSVGEICCQRNAYSVDIVAVLPENVSAHDVALMVVPNTTVGALSVGMRTDRIIDNNASLYIRGVTGTAVPRASCRLACALVLALSLAVSAFPAARDSHVML